MISKTWNHYVGILQLHEAQSGFRLGNTCMECFIVEYKTPYFLAMKTYFEIVNLVDHEDIWVSKVVSVLYWRQPPVWCSCHGNHQYWVIYDWIWHTVTRKVAMKKFYWDAQVFNVNKIKENWTHHAKTQHKKPCGLISSTAKHM